MVNKVTLYFSIDRYAKNAFKIMTGTLETIDKFTIQFSSSKDIKKAYQSEIVEFMDKNKEHIEQIESRTGKKETGDITIIEIDQKGIEKRKRVLYKKHLVVFKSIIDEPVFYDCLSEIETIKIDELNVQPNLSEQHLDKYFEFIREIYNKYKDNYKKLGLPRPEKIYNEYLQAIQENEEQQDYEQLELSFQEGPPTISIQQYYNGITNSLYEEPAECPPEDLYDAHPHNHGQIEYGEYKIRRRK